MIPPDNEQITEIIDQRRPKSSWVKYVAFALVAIIAIICIYHIIYQFTPTKLAATGTGVVDDVAGWGKRFVLWATKETNSGNNNLVEVGPGISTDGLIVAKQDILLQFTNTNTKRIFGTTTAEVRVLATAYYFTPLSGPDSIWNIETSEKDGVRICVIHAPQIRVLTPVAFDSSTIDIKIDTGWLRFNSKEMIQTAITEITPRLNTLALEKSSSIREAARKSIVHFVETWLLDSNDAGGKKFNAIQVLFPGEAPKDVDLSIPHLKD